MEDEEGGGVQRHGVGVGEPIGTATGTPGTTYRQPLTTTR